MPAKRFKGKVVVVTGSRGMGACMGERFAQEGAKAVAFLDIDKGAAQVRWIV